MLPAFLEREGQTVGGGECLQIEDRLQRKGISKTDLLFYGHQDLVKPDRVQHLIKIRFYTNLDRSFVLNLPCKSEGS